MVCYYPLQGYRSKFINPTGKRGIVFNRKESNCYCTDLESSLACRSSIFHLAVPCGQCIGCRLERSRQWAVRCSHEASLHLQNSFITLTYSDEFIPEGLTLVKKHIQDFMKRLKKPIPYQVKQFYCGEYGSVTSRPHYHLLLFGHDFDDKSIFSNNRGNPLYTSEKLSKLWKFGFSSIGAVTFESSAYVARYVLKKVGKKSDNYESHYNGRLPEFCEMSRRPGIASDWFDKYSSDVYPDDFVVIGQRKQKPPSFYDKRLELLDPTLFLDIKNNRKKFVMSDKCRSNSTPRRLFTREQVKLASISSLSRPL